MTCTTHTGIYSDLITLAAGLIALGLLFVIVKTPWFDWPKLGYMPRKTIRYHRVISAIMAVIGLPCLAFGFYIMVKC